MESRDFRRSFTYAELRRFFSDRSRLSDYISVLQNGMDPRHHDFLREIAIRQYTALMNSMFEMELPLDADPRSRTKSGTLTKKDVLRWSVSSSLILSECNLRSDFFKFGPVKNCKFYLVVCSKPAKSYFTLALIKIREGHQRQEDRPAFIKVAFSLLDTRDRCHHTCERTLPDDETSVQASFDRACYSTQHQMFLRAGNLILHCAMDVNEVLTESSDAATSMAKPEDDVDIGLLDACRQLLITGQHHDVVFSVGDEEIKAHKGILATRSPVFSAMFEPHTLERQTSRVVIEDESKETMHCLLKYMYTGCVDQLKPDELLPLLAAADKYDLPQLKEKCANYISDQISKEDVLTVLVAANLHRVEKLKKAASRVVLGNAMEVMDSSAWILFLKEYPEIANEIILQLATGFR